MPSMRLSETLRTSHFRMAAYFLAVFALCSAALLGYVYWKTSFYLAHEVDQGLQRTVGRWSTLPLDVLRREVAGRIQRGDPAVLIGVGGERVAGGFEMVQPIPRYDRPFDALKRDPNGDLTPVRAMATVLDSGLVLVLGHDVHELEEFNERIRTAMAGGIFIVLGMGLVGALVLGSRARRRLDAMAHSLQQIVVGHLDARLPARNSRDDLDRIAILVNSMLDEIQRLMGEVKGVTDDVAHDLRTPLTRMLAGLERAQTVSMSQPELLALVDTTASDARLLLSMFRGLLRISEIENSARRERFETVDLARIAADAVDLFEPAAQEVGVSLRFKGASTALFGDRDLLFDAMSNLIDNAIKFAPEGSEVLVQVVHADHGMRVSVSDAGPGIAESEREAVLRRFYRSERSRNTPGHGLGLSLVAAIARLHDMTFTIEDAQPGCRVSLALPSPS